MIWNSGSVPLKGSKMSKNVIQRVGLSPSPQSFGARYTLAAKGGKAYDPVRKHDWELFIENVGGAQMIPLSAQAVKVPEYESEPGDIWHVNEVTHYLNRGKPSPITANIMDFINPNVLAELWKWWRQGIDENIGASSAGVSTTVQVNSPTGALAGPIMGFATDYKRSLSIEQFDIQGEPVRLWTCYGCFLTKSPCTAEQLSYDGSEALKLDLSISVDRFTVQNLHT